MTQVPFNFEAGPERMSVEPMTRWDHYAAAALAGAAANPNGGGNSPRDFAHWAASLADSMMLERARRIAAQRAEPKTP